MRAIKRLGEMPAGLSDLKRSETLVQWDSRDLLSKYKGSLQRVQRVKHKQENASTKPTCFLFSMAFFTRGRSAEQGGQDDRAGPAPRSIFRARGDQGIPRDWEAEIETLALP